MILLKNGLAFINKKLQEKDILIVNGKINKIQKKIKADRKTRVINCKNHIILPGVIDPHVHVREPGQTHKEDFLTASKAALAGGVTTILDMPNNIPPITTIKRLAEKRKLAKDKCLVNYGFHFGSSKDNLNEIKKARNIASTKIFMNLSTGDMKINDEKTLEEVFRSANMVTVHAEGDKVKQAIDLAKKTKAKLYLCHISSQSEINYLKKTKTNKIFVEVTPHHLLLTIKSNPFYDVKPKLKSKNDNLALFNAVNSGLIDTIGTDHAPHTKKEKMSKNPPSGMPGLESMLPLMLDAVNQKKLTLKRLIELTSENPAKIFGIKNKGFIKAGFDADLIIVDMEHERKIKNDRLFTKTKWTAYHNKLLKGWPVITIVNGNLAYNHGYVNTKFKGKEVKL